MMVKRILILLTLVLAFALAISVQAASARPSDGSPNAVSAPPVAQTSQPLSERSPVMNGPSSREAGAPSPAAASASDPAGFDWGDAGIGAGVVLATMIVGAVGLVAIRWHRHHPGQLAH
jgi:hypothetical protein